MQITIKAISSSENKKHWPQSRAQFIRVISVTGGHLQSFFHFFPHDSDGRHMMGAPPPTGAATERDTGMWGSQWHDDSWHDETVTWSCRSHAAKSVSHMTWNSDWDWDMSMTPQWDSHMTQMGDTWVRLPRQDERRRETGRARVTWSEHATRSIHAHGVIQGTTPPTSLIYFFMQITIKAITSSENKKHRPQSRAQFIRVISVTGGHFQSFFHFFPHDSNGRHMMGAPPPHVIAQVIQKCGLYLKLFRATVIAWTFSN